MATIEPENQEDLLEELTAQLEDGKQIRFILDTTENLTPGEYVVVLSDVRFEDGVIKAKLELP